jgi:putative hydrolase of the HAD superfamily
VVCSAQIGWRTPARQICAKALAELYAAPETAVRVGDSVPDDIAGAQALGLRTVLLQRGTSDGAAAHGAPDAVIHELVQLPHLVIGSEDL